MLSSALRMSRQSAGARMSLSGTRMQIPCKLRGVQSLSATGLYNGQSASELKHKCPV